MTIIMSLVALFVITCVYLIALPKVITDNLRQSLFEIRSRLFEIAEQDPNFGFSNPMYKKFENHLNANIQIAHICTIWHILIYSIISKVAGKQWSTSQTLSLVEIFEKESKNIQSPETKKELENLIRRYYLEVMFNVILSAPITAGFFILTVVFPILIWNYRQKIQIKLFRAIQSQSSTYRHAHQF